MEEPCTDGKVKSTEVGQTNVKGATDTIDALSLSSQMVFLEVMSLRAGEGAPDIFSSTSATLQNLHFRTFKVWKVCVVAFVLFKTVIAEPTSAKQERKYLFQIKRMFSKMHFLRCVDFRKKSKHIFQLLNFIKWRFHWIGWVDHERASESYGIL